VTYGEQLKRLRLGMQPPMTQQGAVAFPRARGMLKLCPSRDQIAKASSSNATATRRLGGSSTASS
jgi:hypothetical protein